MGSQAVIFHGLLNVATFLNLTSNRAEGTASSWLLLSLFAVPLALYGLYLLSGLPRTGAPSKAALSPESLAG